MGDSLSLNESREKLPGRLWPLIHVFWVSERPCGEGQGLPRLRWERSLAFVLSPALCSVWCTAVVPRNPGWGLGFWGSLERVRNHRLGFRQALWFHQELWLSQCRINYCSASLEGASWGLSLVGWRKAFQLTGGDVGGKRRWGQIAFSWLSDVRVCWRKLWARDGQVGWEGHPSLHFYFWQA